MTLAAPVRGALGAALLPATDAPPDGAVRAHLESHRDRVPGLSHAAQDLAEDPAEVAPLDAVLVPAYRSPAHLRAAAEVARSAGSHLVLLCSGQVRADDALAAVDTWCPPADRPAGMAVVAVELGRAGLLDPPARPGTRNRSGIPDVGVHLETSEHPAAAPWRRHDAHLKRNLGLQLARLLGWHRILFHNDDVTGLSPQRLQAMLAVLGNEPGEPSAVGWAFARFPDNSVVCHAHREAGAAQDTFISDGVLALTVSPRLPFFPAVYNEDWLFLHPLLRRGELLLAGDALEQLPYDPFADPGRAVAEEFGDVLGEGLLRLDHLGEPVETAEDADFWVAELSCRAELIADVRRRLRDHPRRERIRHCLAGALAQHRKDWPQQLAGYVQAWHEDLRVWEKHLAGLPTGLDLDGALRHLDLATRTRISRPRPL